MTSPGLFLAFLLAAGLICVTPGPDMIFVAAFGVARGWRGGVAAAGGVALGMAAHTVLAASGLSLLIARVPPAFLALRVLGAGYLAWMGWGMIRSRRETVAGAGAGSGGNLWRITGRAALVNLTNPKILVFYLAFLPQFTTRSGPPVFVQMLVLGSIFVGMGFLTDSSVGILSGRWAARQAPRSTPSGRVGLACGGVLIVLAGVLAAGF